MDRGGQSRGVFSWNVQTFSVCTASSSLRTERPGIPMLGAGLPASVCGADRWTVASKSGHALPLKSCPSLPGSPCLSRTVRPASVEREPDLLSQNAVFCSRQGPASDALVCSCWASRGGLTPVGGAPAGASSCSSRGCGTGIGGFPAGDGWRSARWEEQSERAVVLGELLQEPLGHIHHALYVNYLVSKNLG